MPNKAAAAKAVRQTKKHTSHNRQVLAGVEIAIKAAHKAIAGKDKSAAAKVQAAIKTIDRAGQKGILKSNNAARKKSRLMKALHASAKK